MQTPSPVVELTLTSDAFDPGGEMPADYTCDGDNSSPPLTWTNPPPRAVSFALIVDDPDAPGGVFTHWVVYNLLNWARDLPEGVKKAERLESGGFQGVNDFGEDGYGGPCPAPGAPHRYRFRLYAIAGLINLNPGAAKQDVLDAMAGRIVGQAELLGTYARPAGP